MKVKEAGWCQRCTDACLWNFAWKEKGEAQPGEACKETLQHFMLPSADQLFGDDVCVSHQDLAPAYAAISTDSLLTTLSLPLVGQQTSRSEGSSNQALCADTTFSEVQLLCIKNLFRDVYIYVCLLCFRYSRIRKCFRQPSRCCRTVKPKLTSFACRSARRCRPTSRATTHRVSDWRLVLIQLHVICRFL